MLAIATAAPSRAQDPRAYSAAFPDTMAARVFPLFAMLRAAPGWTQALRADPALAALAVERAGRVAATGCQPQPRCLADAWTWTPADIAAVDARLRLFAGRPELAGPLVAAQLRPSGRFVRHAGLSDTDLLSAAWRDAAAALNRVIAIYARGEAPLNPAIDSWIFDAGHPGYLRMLEAHGIATAANGQADDTLFDPALRYALGLLMMNERTDAGEFRPLLGGENAGTVAMVASTDWAARPYSALLVFGHGPQDPQSRTGVLAHVRLSLAAAMFARGLAPFLIVSGGSVHPDRTPFNEAVEMKRLLVAHHGVPADRILIEPHARHTTTNMRNSARLLLAAGFPTDRPALIVSDHVTIGYIGSRELAERNLREMGIQPGRLAPGPNRFSLAFTPDPIAFHVEATNPLDP